MPRRAVPLALVAAFLWLPSIARAEVTRVVIRSRTVVAGGAAFGASGAYEKLAGTVEFALDPRNPRNAAIVDLDHAPVASDGKVHFTSDLYVLRPVDAAKGNGILLFEVANRGNKLIFGYFNGVRGRERNDPTNTADFGDAFLMREGYTVVWVGWQFDVDPPLIGVEAPQTDMAHSPAPNRVRISFIVDSATTDAAPRDLPRYVPADPNDPTATLTVRDRFWDTPRALPRSTWRIVVPPSGRPHVALDTGFEPGRVYQLDYRARGAVVAGVGLAALRDAASAFTHRQDLPISGRTAFIFGASQSGRLLRQFLYEGFNADEQNRRVFALAWPHIAGGGMGSFNERFATPGYSSFPATRPPFSYSDLLAKYTADQAPRVIVTNTAVEYWGQGRAAALIHTSADGARDLAIPDNVRIYFLSGTQHGAAPFPPPQGPGQQLSNPTPQVEVMHALLRAAREWVTDGTAPPASRYPRLSDHTLVAVADLRFPRIPRMADPTAVEGPGEIRNGKFVARPFLVPAVDPDGNDIAGIRVPALLVPLATATGWNFRAPRVGNPTTIYALLGSYVPFPTTAAARAAQHDPRPSIDERYRDKQDYLQRLRDAALTLVRDRYLLADDVPNVMSRGEAEWTWVHRSNTADTQAAK